MISPDVFVRRRQRILDELEPGVLVLPSAPVALRNNDVEHDYRQDSDVHYLTGFDEPESVVVLRMPSEKPFTLFLRPRDPERETWDGPRLGVEGAVAELGADQAFPIQELAERLPELLQDVPRVYYRLGRQRAFDDRLLAALDRVRARARLGVSCPSAIVDPQVLVHEHRLRKSPEELALMREAASITGEAHRTAMARARPGWFEYQVEACLEEVFRRRGARRAAYGSIVGSGPNATVLHYRSNDRRIEEGDLLLIDAGCEYQYYASDVTRTFPVGGRFSGEQRALYELVLAAQQASIARARVGATLEDVHRASVEILAQGLLDLGLVEGPLEAVLEEQRYRKFYMHRTSHWLGMDVHDVGVYHREGKPRPLEEGMVITVEPGLYVAPGAEVDARFRGIGIRIEDDVLIGAEGPTVLTHDVPKAVDEVEHAVRALAG